MNILINRVAVIAGVVALSMGLVNPSYAGIDEAAQDVGQMVGRYNVIRNGMCRAFSTPHMNKYVKANDKFFGGRSYIAKVRYKRGREEGAAQWHMVMANIKMKDPDSFADTDKLKKRCEQIDSDAKDQFDQIAMLGIYE